MTRSEQEIIERFSKADEPTKFVVKVTLGVDLDKELSVDSFGKLLSEIDPKTNQTLEKCLFDDEDFSVSETRLETGRNLMDFVRKHRDNLSKDMTLRDDKVMLELTNDPCGLGFDIGFDVVFDFRNDDVYIDITPKPTIDELIRKMGAKASRANIDRVLEFDTRDVYFYKREGEKETRFCYRHHLIGYEYGKAMKHYVEMLVSMERLISKMKEEFMKGEGERQ